MLMLWFPESRQSKKLDQMKYLYANDMGLLSVGNDLRKKLTTTRYSILPHLDVRTKNEAHPKVINQRIVPRSIL